MVGQDSKGDPFDGGKTDRVRLPPNVPGKRWFMIFRVYGPLEPWFDKTWRPGEIELQP